MSKIKGAKLSFADAYKNLETEGYTSQNNVGQKMATLVKAWKDPYQVSGFKGMFGTKSIKGISIIGSFQLPQ